MLKNRSGQYVYFTLVSAISGNPVTGASGQISGRKSLDGLSGMIVLSGNIIELGGGSYRANLFDFDTNGDQAGYLFTASGCVPVQFQFDMLDGNGSGRLYPASGMTFIASGPNAVVPPATLSGVVVNSGLNVTVPIATLSGVVANSGLNVTVPIATLSGVVANSGLFVTVPRATISGVIANSGLFVTVPTATLSGVVPASGAFVTLPKETISGVIANSGLFTNASLNSGQSVLVYSGQLSGQMVNLLSGNTVAVISGQVGREVLTYGFSGLAGGTFSGQRNLLNAARKLMNKFDQSSSGYFKFFEEDDSTLAFRQAATLASGAPPVGALDTE